MNAVIAIASGLAQLVTRLTAAPHVAVVELAVIIGSIVSGRGQAVPSLRPRGHDETGATGLTRSRITPIPKAAADVADEAANDEQRDDSCRSK